MGAECELRLILSYGWLEFRRLNKICGWFHHMADSSSSGWIRVAADYILRLFQVLVARYELQLIPSCDWLRVVAVLSCGWLNICRLDSTCGWHILNIPSKFKDWLAKYIIFIVSFLLAHFCYDWFRLWLLLQEPWWSLKKLEEAWRSFKTLAVTDLSCSGWFELLRLIWDLRPIDYLRNFDPDPLDSNTLVLFFQN